MKLHCWTGGQVKATEVTILVYSDMISEELPLVFTGMAALAVRLQIKRVPKSIASRGTKTVGDSK